MEKEINGLIKALEENKEKEGLKNQALINRFKALLELMEKYKGKKEFSDKQLKEIQSITCFKHLAFCCRKPCPFRNTALYILNIEPKDFEREKETLIGEWLKGWNSYSYKTETILLVPAAKEGRKWKKKKTAKKNLS